MTADIALINMPFFTLSLPSLGLSLLKSELDRAGYSSKIYYLNLSFSSHVGYDLYQSVDDQPIARLALEWVFAESLWGVNRERDEKFIQRLSEEEDRKF